MNKLKEIYLTVFTFPRYTLWKRSGKDRFLESVVVYISVITIYLLVAFKHDFRILQFIPIWVYIILWAIGGSYYHSLKRGD